MKGVINKIGVRDMGRTLTTFHWYDFTLAIMGTAMVLCSCDNLIKK